MAHQFFEFLRSALIHYGYWAVAAALLLESAGLPLPGEITLLLASFMAYSQNELRLQWLIVVATLAATIGGNLGYLAGWKGGRPLLDRLHISPRTIAQGEELFIRYGAVTIFFARFIFGMRIIAGPLAGVLHMPWKKFTIYNFVGALVWVSVISGVAFAFGSQWGRVAHVVKQLDWAMLAVGGAVVVVWWVRRKRAER
jgi:membrane protein DedA with SNARE-associated domain